MTRARTAMAGAAALGAAVLVFVSAVLPSPARRLAPPSWSPARPVVSGVFHVHTVRSDGAGTVDEVAAAASRAGLRFVIVTDHGDGTRRPDAPAYRSGVLCLDGVEISTSAGHYAAVGMGQAPYPLGGDPRDVVEDVARLGGIGIVTHPDSPKPALAWGGWDARFDGLEWINADTEWRRQSSARLAIALATYPFRPSETLASLFRRPATLAAWDRVERGRRVVALAGIDAHAQVAWKPEGPEGGSRESLTLLRLPGYEPAFRVFSLRVTLARPLSGRASDDAAMLLGALRAGHVHTIVDAYARPGALEFSGSTSAGDVMEGDTATLTDALVLRARSNGPPGTRLVLFRDGQETHRVTSSELVYATNRPGNYRVEAWLPGVERLPMPWAVSNPITAVAAGAPSPAVVPAPPPGGEVVAAVDSAQGWHVEHDPGSSGGWASRDGGTGLDFRLGSTPGGSPFVALVHPLRLPASAAALAFRVAAPQPMRVSVQLRVPVPTQGERWGRSVYLDTTPRDLVVPLADLRPVGRVSSPAPRVADVDSLLFVVDRVHTRPGTEGRFAVSNVRVLGPAR